MHPTARGYSRWVREFAYGRPHLLWISHTRGRERKGQITSCSTMTGRTLLMDEDSTGVNSSYSIWSMSEAYPPNSCASGDRG